MHSPSSSFTKSLSSKQNLINQQSALIKNLKQQVKNADLQNFYQQTSLNFPERSSPSKKTYAQELLKQIDEKAQNQKHVKHSKILEHQSEQYLLSLNIPRTSSQIRRRRDKELQSKIKQELEAQIIEKNFKTQSEKSQNIQNERKEVEILMKKLQDEEREQIQQSKIELDYLTKSWKKQVQFKELKTQVTKMEINGVVPRPKGIFLKKESLSPSSLNVVGKPQEFKEETKNLTPVISIKKQLKVGYKDRARVIKSKIDQKYKDSYLYKLKKVIENVKSTRRLPINSLSPSNNASYKRLA